MIRCYIAFMILPSNIGTCVCITSSAPKLQMFPNVTLSQTLYFLELNYNFVISKGKEIMLSIMLVILKPYFDQRKNMQLYQESRKSSIIFPLYLKTWKRNCQPKRICEWGFHIYFIFCWFCGVVFVIVIIYMIIIPRWLIWHK